MPRKEKAPHWISRWAYGTPSYPFFDSTCSECGYKTAMVRDEWQGKCPKCGAQLQTDQDDE